MNEKSTQGSESAKSGIEIASVAHISPTQIWIENGVMGERVVVMQHEGCDPFDYAVFAYDYRYTSNSGTWESARKLALALGASEPIEQRPRNVSHKHSAEELREYIKEMQEMLDKLES